MARRRFEDGEKKPVTKAGLKKFLGVFQFVTPYRGSFVMGLIALLFSSLTALCFPLLGGKFIDAANGTSTFFLSTITSMALGFMVIILLQATFSYLRVYFFSRFTERSLADMRLAVYQKMVWLPQSFFDSRRIGELMSRVTSDVTTVSDAFTFMLAELLRQIVVLIGGILFISLLTPKLTLFMLLTFPLLVISALYFGKFIRKLSKKTQDQLAGANVVVEETLQSISVVKAFTNEMFEVGRYRKSLQDVVATALKTAKYRGLFFSFTIVAMFGGIIAVMWYGGYLVQNGTMTSGDLISFVFYTTFVGASIAGLGDLYGQLQRSIGASERVLEILDLPDEKGDYEETLKLRGEISFNKVSFKYPTRSDITVLKSMSFDIASGEKVALVGPSGSGKSTIINLLMRFYETTDGAIVVDGQNAKNYPLSAYRKNIGIVPQEVILFGGTIRENIAYGKPGASDSEIEVAARKANAWEFIETFPEGLNTIVGDRGVKLSGGQRQRVAIARAILKDPSILILDEATSSLDAGSERLVQEALEKLMENRTTIVIAHRLSTIRKVDRILVIKEGEIAESGTHTELNALDDGIYSNLLKMQLEVTE
ncbi:MAG TPA: ABC transporter transmembrane domain-containing protein [Cyclobacteriaceae bacterium]|nr:ABC transporter transmembrane domain-containing protein [Cyclobacteriaceae bacterium]